MKLLNVIFTFFIMIFVSCASNVHVAKLPMYSYPESDYSFDTPRDINISLSPGVSGMWNVTCVSAGVQNAQVVKGASLETVLSTIFPDGDAFKHGKIIDKNRKEVLPYFNTVMSDKTELSIRALSVGKLNK